MMIAVVMTIMMMIMMVIMMIMMVIMMVIMIMTIMIMIMIIIMGNYCILCIHTDIAVHIRTHMISDRMLDMVLIDIASKDVMFNIT